MELETLEIIFDANIERIEEKMAPFLSKMENTMNKLSSITGKGTGAVEKDLSSTAGMEKFNKNVEKMTAIMEKNLSRMERSAEDSGKKTGVALVKGMNKGTVKMSQDVQTAVDKVNLKMQQARAAQKKISNLSGDRRGAAISGDGKAVSKYDEKIANAQIQMNRAQSDAQAIVRKLKAEYDAIPQSIKRGETQMQQNEAQIERMRQKVKSLNDLMKQQQIEKGSFGKSGWQTKGYEDTKSSAKTSGEIAKLEVKMQKLIDENDRLMQQLGTMDDRAGMLKGALSGLNTELGETGTKSAMATNGMRNLAGLSKNTQGIFSRLKGVFTSAGNSFKNGVGRMGSIFSRQSNQVSSGANRMSSSIGGFGRTMKMLWSQLFIFSFLYQGIMKLAGGLWSAMKTNDQFASSLNQIKVNLLTAFYPIYTAVMPAINTLMAGIAKVTGYIASFIATMFGTTYAAAKQGAEGLQANMDALKDTGKASDKTKEKVKKLQQVLMGFDEINTLKFDTDDDSDDSLEEPSTPGGLDWSGAEPQTPAWLENFANKFKEIMSKLFDPIKAAWDAQGQKVIDAWKYALREVIGLIQAIGRSFMEVWTNGTGQRFVENLLILLADVLSIIGDIAGAFRRAWEDGGRGTALIQSIFDMFNAVLELLHEIAVAFRNAWNDDGLGQRIAAHLLEIFTNINNTVANLANRFTEAWTQGAVGESIFKTILRIIEGVLGNINNITRATAEWAKTLDFTPLLQSIDNLLKSIEPLTKNIGAGLEWFYKNVLLPLASYTIQELIPAFLKLLAGAIDLLNGVIEGLKPAFKWLWDNFLQPIAKWTGGVIVSVLEKIGKVLSALGKWISEHSEGFSNFVLLIGTFAGVLKGISILSGVVSVLGSVFKLLSGITSIGKLLGTVATAIGSLVSFLGGPLTVAIAAVIAIGVLLYKNWDTIKEKASELVSWIGEKWEQLKTFTSETWENIKTAVSEKWNEMKEAVVETVTNLWNGITETFSNIANSVSEKAGQAKDWVGEKWDGMKTTVSETASSIAQTTSEKFSEIANTVSEKAGNVKDWASEKFTSMKDTFVEVNKKMYEVTKEKFEQIASTARDKAGNAKDWASGKWTELKNNTSTKFEEIKSAASTKMSSTAEAVRNGANNARSRAVEAFTSLKDGVSNRLQSVKDVASDVFGKIGNWASELPGKIASGLRNGIDAIGNTIKSIANTIARPIAHAVNNVIGAINWVLGAVNSGWSINKWEVPNYAKGTNYHPGGLALVNDGSGSRWQEMFRLPTGELGMFPRRKNMLVDLPRGTQVLPGNAVPEYAGGIFSTFKKFFSGGFDKEDLGGIWGVISKPSTLVNEAMSKFVNLSVMDNPMYSIANGFLKSAKSAVTNMVVEMINRFTGFENGGLITKHGFFEGAEGDKPEMILPLTNPARALELINDSFDFMGMDGIPELTMPEVFRSAEPTTSSSIGGSSRSGSLTSFRGNDLPELGNQMAATIGNKVTEAIMQLVGVLGVTNTGNNTEDTSLEVILQVDSTRLGEVAVKGINKYHKKTGRIELIY
ncbi:hypothetical protein [Enterococcus pallens]|uniref:Phage tail tape measure protein, TP901 family, core region n=1 Tax=Enterococcus pallens ATCC BAA-351 TaxID=1158607 RepID=R2QI39_9ENTE|nr:hypothetical protein [Enterococcus pallens]EOH94848.1 hypothetical protein UAU_01770 [Enterococcus pallens ATCC BAA-351]EOU14833.1 hypothetical protein I588_04483 [Enterococcus pallens ATCC BAA-351]OJG76210.1 hypothetical protein RV10_GL004117 [Enterococcus pallens]